MSLILMSPWTVCILDWFVVVYALVEWPVPRVHFHTWSVLLRLETGFQELANIYCCIFQFFVWEWTNAVTDDVGKVEISDQHALSIVRHFRFRIYVDFWIYFSLFFSCFLLLVFLFWFLLFWFLLFWFLLFWFLLFCLIFLVVSFV